MGGMNQIVKKQAAVICVLGLAAITLYLCYIIAMPFLGPFLIAVMLAIVFIRFTRKFTFSFTTPAWLSSL
jgi:predicted PurR-regulated permease PerM